MNNRYSNSRTLLTRADSKKKSEKVDVKEIPPEYAAKLDKILRSKEGEKNSVSERYEDLLASTKSLYDEVHVACVKKRRELKKIKDDIQRLEYAISKQEQDFQDLGSDFAQTEDRIGDLNSEISTAVETKDILMSMSELNKKNKDYLGQKNIKLEEGITKLNVVRRDMNRRKQRQIIEIEKLENTKEMLKSETDAEVFVGTTAVESLQEGIKAKKEEIDTSKKFSAWRQHVSQDALEEASVAETTRLKKIYAITQWERWKLQKATVQASDLSQEIEESFYQIKEVTGLQSVDEIVKKFLQRREEENLLLVNAHDTEKLLQDLRAEQQVIHDNALKKTVEKSKTDTMNINLKETEKQVAGIEMSNIQLENRRDLLKVAMNYLLRWVHRINECYTNLGIEVKYTKLESATDIIDYIKCLDYSFNKFKSCARERV